MREMKLKELKQKSPTELLAFAEENDVENASTMRKQELMFAILKQLASVEVQIIGEGVVEILQDGFAFLRSADANYLPGPDDIYVSPSQIRRLGLADRRYGRRGDPEPQGRRALFRAAQMQRNQFRGPGKDPAQGPLRQFDAALSRRTVTARGRRPDPQGYVGAGHRYRRADRQGAAGAHRRAAAHRQDGAACRTSPSRSPPITRNAI